MTKRYKVIKPEDLRGLGGLTHEFALDVLLGLSKTEKSLPSRYFYDDRGSKLFQRITELDEYYPTACERQILRSHHGRIAELLEGEPFNLLDLGTGDGHKTDILLSGFLDRGLDCVYVPIDISEEAVRAQNETLERRHPELRVEGMVADYADGLLWHSRRRDRPNLVALLGSNIGNFHRSEARAFLRRLWSYLAPGDLLLIGFDLKKDIDRMLLAYNDTQGVTAAFNLNLLSRINRELGGEFELDQFRHFATYSVFSGAMESYLVSLREQTVRVEDLHHQFHFRPFEPVHTQYSYKFLVSDIESLAEETGFAIEAQLFDDRGWFVDSVWRVIKDEDPAAA